MSLGGDDEGQSPLKIERRDANMGSGFSRGRHIEVRCTDRFKSYSQLSVSQGFNHSERANAG